MSSEAPKTMAETRARMFEAVRVFRARVAATPAAREKLATQARRTIDRLRKQFQHNIDDQLRLDAKRRHGLSESERLGLEETLRQAADGASRALTAAVESLSEQNPDG